VVVVAIILVAFSFYWGLSGSQNGAAERELLDPTGTTVATNLQNKLEAGSGNGPNSAPAYGHPAAPQNNRLGPDGHPATPDNTTATNPSTNPAPAPNVRQPLTVPGRAVYKAQGEQCMENLRELRMMIQMATDDNNGTFPRSLTDVPDSIKVRTCPIGGQDYVYDPDTGKVHCTTPGHESY